MPESSPTGLPSDRLNSETNRRVWIRYPSRRAIHCQPAGRDDQPFLAAQACDVSLGGIKLVAPHKFERGAILKLRAVNEKTEKSSDFTAEVRYAMPTPEGKWIMGCAFLKELSEKEILAWLEEQSPELETAPISLSNLKGG